MANTTIKITQLQNIGNGLAANTLLPVVNTSGTAITQKVTVGNVANFIMNQAGNTLAPAFLANLAYSVVNAAQPNITSVGTLSVNTLKISGGTNGYFLQTDGTGNLSWAVVGGGGNGSPGGSNTQIQFNNEGEFDGDANLTWNVDTQRLLTSAIEPGAIYTDEYYYANGDPFIGGNYGNSNVANYLPTYTGNLTAGNILVGDNSGPGDYFIERTDTSVSMGTAGGQQISVSDTNGISIGGTGGVQIQGVAGANVVLGGSTSGNIYLEQSLVFSDNTVQSTAYTGGGANIGNVTFDDVTIQGVNGLNLSAGSDFTANLAYLQVRAGDVASHIHFDTGNNQAYDLIVGDDQKHVQVSSTGNIIISSYDVTNALGYTWALDNTGNVSLPTNGDVNFNGGGIVQTVDENFTILVQDSQDDGYELNLNVDDGAGVVQTRVQLTRDDVRIQTDMPGQNYDWLFNSYSGILNIPGNIQGIYGGNTSFYAYDNGSGGSVELKTISHAGDALGSNVRVTQSNATISTGGGTYSWNFDNTGNVTVPGNILSTQASNLTIGSSYSVKIVGDNGDNNLTWTFDGSSGELQLPFGAIIDPSDDNFEVRGVANVNFEAGNVVNIYTDIANNGYQWQFGDDGNLVVPKNIVGTNSSAPIIIDAGTTLDSYLSVPSFTDGNEQLVIVNKYSSGNGIRLETQSGNWLFGGDGTLAIPGNLTGTGASPAPSINGFDSASFVGNVSGDVGLFNDINLNNVTTNRILYADGNRNIYDTGFGYTSANDTATGGNLSLTGNISASNLGNIAGVNLDGNVSNVLYGNGAFAAAPGGSYGNSNVVTLLSSFGSNTITTTGNVSVGAVSAGGKIGYSSGATVTQTTNRGQGVTINALAGTIVTTSDTIAPNDVDVFYVNNNQVDPTTDIVIAQITSYNPGTYVLVAQPVSTPANGFMLSISNYTLFASSTEAITIRFMVMKSPNA